MDFLNISERCRVPELAGAIAAGVFVYLTLKFILEGVTGSVTTLKNIIAQLDNRVQTMNNDLVKIDALLSHVLGVNQMLIVLRPMRVKRTQGEINGTNSRYSTNY